MSLSIVHNNAYPQKAHNSPAVKVPGLIFCSGQVGKDADIEKATTTALSNLKAVLELGGSSLEQVVKYNIYLLDMADYDAMNKAFVAFLPHPKVSVGDNGSSLTAELEPARTCIQAATLPAKAIIEIECIAQC